MQASRLSSKHQVVIPKEIRRKLSLRKGQKITAFTKAGAVILIPALALQDYRGFLKGMNVKNIREKRERT